MGCILICLSTLQLCAVKTSPTADCYSWCPLNQRQFNMHLCNVGDNPLFFTK